MFNDMETIDNNKKNNTLPEYIESHLSGTRFNFKIPTDPDKKLRSERRNIIKIAYKLLLSKLKGKNYIKNDFLNENIYIIWFDENYRSFDIKEGNQTKNRYVELIKLRYTFNSKVHDYMNFTIELVIGKKQDGKNVQYSLEYIKKACS